MTNREVEVNLSTASLLPKSALLSTSYCESKAIDELGFDGIEVLLTKTAAKEALETGQLSASPKMVKSIHQDWRRDQTAEREYNLVVEGKNGKRSLGREVIAWLLRNPFFLSQEQCFAAIEVLEKTYHVPVIHHWPSDSDKFKRPCLEIHPDFPSNFDASPESLINWVEEKPESRSLTLDLSERKLWNWLKRQNISEKELPSVINRLCPYLKEAHFQIGNSSEYKQVKDRNYDDTLGRMVDLLKKKGFSGPYVLEIKPTIASMIKDDLSICQSSAEFIRNINSRVF